MCETEDNALFNELVPIVESQVRRLDDRLRQHVAEYPGMSRDDRRSYANEIAWTLLTGTCRCGKGHCAQQHHLAAWASSGLSSQRFVHRAVHGPMGLPPQGLLANSIEGGMMAPHLRDDYQIIPAWVVFKRCHLCGAQYESRACLSDRCGGVFVPETTPIIAVRWLIQEGAYVSKRYWGHGKGTDKHFFEQMSCCEEVVDTIPKVRYKKNPCGPTHDRCLWQGCREKDSTHGQRGTTLWVRANFMGAAAQTGLVLPNLSEGVADGMLRALDLIPEETKTQLLARFGEIRPENVGQLLQEWQRILSPHLFEKVRETIQIVLAERGLDEDKIDRFFSRATPRPTEREVTQNEFQDDNS